MISLDDVRAAARTLSGVAHRTPVLTSRTLDRRTGATVFCKAECYQRGGAFKFRGAYNRISSLSQAQRERGVGAFSSGNHAQAVALAASLLGARATIVMPEDTPKAKLEATREYGAEVVFYDRYSQDREAIGTALAGERGLTLVPPYEDDFVMAGQGTAALELIDEVGSLDTLLVPVGGGGLIAGSSTAAKGVLPDVRVLGVEPAVRDITKRSLEKGERVRVPVPQTIADGQQGDIPGAMTFEVNRRRVDDVALVTDEQILDAMTLLFERMKVVAEPSGASALAALLAGLVDVEGQRVGVVLSGGNVGIQRFCDLMRLHRSGAAG
ncbi:MAG: pyridoxal-phosphate dependent enzyme [Nitriliruptorales bacterium]|nr:pyridoxal-phosphate dependent enzyme [Nitriliruptorales bacterium]